MRSITNRLIIHHEWCWMFKKMQRSLIGSILSLKSPEKYGKSLVKVQILLFSINTFFNPCEKKGWITARVSLWWFRVFFYKPENSTEFPRNTFRMRIQTGSCIINVKFELNTILTYNFNVQPCTNRESLEFLLKKSTEKTTCFSLQLSFPH